MMKEKHLLKHITKFYQVPSSDTSVAVLNNFVFCAVGFYMGPLDYFAHSEPI